MLEIRPNCECCDRDLSVDNPDVFICSFECTWCADCVTTFDNSMCPNCGGNLTRRPIRPASTLVDNPASATRVFNPDCLARIGSVA